MDTMDTGDKCQATVLSNTGTQQTNFWATVFLTHGHNGRSVSG